MYFGNIFIRSYYNLLVSVVKVIENIEKILSTIISRCQKLDLVFPNAESDIEKINKARDFLNSIITNGKKTIAYEYDFFKEELTNRVEYYSLFENMEKIISQTINKKYDYSFDNNYLCERLLSYSDNTLINILNITNKLKCLIKGNINLNLLIDRYIIEMERGDLLA